MILTMEYPIGYGFITIAMSSWWFENTNIVV